MRRTAEPADSDLFPFKFFRPIDFLSRNEHVRKRVHGDRQVGIDGLARESKTSISDSPCFLSPLVSFNWSDR